MAKRCSYRLILIVPIQALILNARLQNISLQRTFRINLSTEQLLLIITHFQLYFVKSTFHIFGTQHSASVDQPTKNGNYDDLQNISLQPSKEHTYNYAKICLYSTATIYSLYKHMFLEIEKLRQLETASKHELRSVSII